MSERPSVHRAVVCVPVPSEGAGTVSSLSCSDDPSRPGDFPTLPDPAVGTGAHVPPQSLNHVFTFKISRKANHCPSSKQLIRG